jgi:hypothetical protein
MAVDPLWLAALCRRTDALLFEGDSFVRAVGGGRGAARDASPAATWPRILFPPRGKERRLSEQEARFAFVAALLDEPAPHEWAFAAEAPTRLSYRFPQRGGASKAQKGLTDLALYRGDPDRPALAVEFKAGGRWGKSENDQSIRMDVAKLIAEEPDGLWFHVLRDANAQTLRGAVGALAAAIADLSSRFRLADYLAPGKQAEPRPKRLTFHLCLLGEGPAVALHRELEYAPGKFRPELLDLELAEAGDATGETGITLGADSSWKLDTAEGDPASTG